MLNTKLVYKDKDSPNDQEEQWFTHESQICVNLQSINTQTEGLHTRACEHECSVSKIYPTVVNVCKSTFILRF